MHFNQIKDAEKVLIYGYGAEGRSSKKFLTQRFPDKTIAVFDENIESYKKNNDLTQFDIIVVTPGVDRTEKIPENLRDRCTSNIEIFFHNLPERLRTKIIGITGTKGKSTTTKFCAEFLENIGKKVVIGGNFGAPFLDLFDDFLAEKYDYLVAEYSSFQLEYLDISPGIAIFLNLFPDHLDRHKTLAKYFAAKSNLWRHQKSGDFLIFCETVGSLFKPKELEERGIRFFVGKKVNKNFFLRNSVFRADHFRENLGAVFMLSKILNVEDEFFVRTAETFKGLPHRIEFFKEKHQIRFYDDSIAVNPDSTLAAIKFFKTTLGMIILGGKSGGGSFQSVIEFLKNLDEAKIIVVDSEVGLEVLEELKRQNFPKHRYFFVKSLEESINLIFKETPKNTACVLSPGAKSFDKFKNFKERGSHFKKLIREY